MSNFIQLVCALKKCSAVMGSKGRAWSGSQGAKPPKGETLSVFGHAMEAANLSVFIFGDAKESHISVLSCRNDV